MPSTKTVFDRKFLLPGMNACTYIGSGLCMHVCIYSNNGHAHILLCIHIAVKSDNLECVAGSFFSGSIAVHAMAWLYSYCSLS